MRTESPYRCGCIWSKVDEKIIDEKNSRSICEIRSRSRQEVHTRSPSIHRVVFKRTPFKEVQSRPLSGGSDDGSDMGTIDGDIIKRP